MIKMEKEKFEESMQNLTSPDVNAESHMKLFKIYLLHTRKSAIAGFLLLLTPFLFLLGVIFSFYLEIKIPIINGVYHWIAENDNTPVLNWIQRFLLLGGPLVAILINLLSILHFQWNSKLKEFIITIKVKWLNLTIILACGLIFFIFFTYLVVENLGHP